MTDFGTVEDTLYVPMLGRIYASEQFPDILYDKKALELNDRLPKRVKEQDTQSQYTLMAGAVRSTNMDRYIRGFLQRNPDGVIVLLGSGLETTFYRNDNGKTVWYEVDLPDVIEYRRKLLGESERDIYLAEDAFGEAWVCRVRADCPDAPMLVAASGLFYYFEREKVLDLLRKLGQYGNVELVFDTVNAKGMKRMAKYMKQVGHADAPMYFYVDSAREVASEVGGSVLNEEPYYAHTNKKGLSLMTSLTMKASDCFSMVKMIHMKLGTNR